MKIIHKSRAAVGRSPGSLVVHVNATQLVMLLLIQAEPAIGMAFYLAGAILPGRGHDLWEMVGENFL
jgi:pyruvate dehydrogenase (quinone)